MDFELWPAVGAGAAATALIAGVAVVVNRTRLSGLDVFLLHGSFLTGRVRPAIALGFVAHVLLFGGLVFGSLYASLFDVLGLETTEAWWFGLMLGAVHGWFAGLLLSAIDLVHPRMAHDSSGPPDTLVLERSPEPDPTDVPVAGASRFGRQVLTAAPLRLRAPGPFGSQYGSLTPVEVVLGHTLYGLLVGLLYAAFV